MAKSKKIQHQFGIHKAGVKQSAYLLVWSAETPLERDPESGMLTVDLDDILGSSEASAWTTLSAAKRYAAQKVGRTRLPWEERTEGEDTNWSATYTERVSN